MKLYGEILKNFSGGAFASSRCTLLVGGGGYFQGVKGIVEYGGSVILLALKEGTLRIEGERLSVKKFCDGDLELSGCIRGFSLLEEGV